MRSIIVALSIIVTVCATNPGPVGSPEFGALVAAALPPEEASHVQVSGPGTWTPNSRRMIEFQNSGRIVPDAMPWKDGVTIIAPSGLFFPERDARTREYTITKRIPRANIADATLDVVGRSCALVVQEAGDSTFHVFDFVRAGGVLNDCATARLAEAALSATR